ncbi:dihydrofolate reductase protein [Rhizobium phage RHph_N3_2]|nr:dihydrofolate reductase protein [Rhizobium phage RHph_N3_2]QIG75028.1 dihydrofolate reductase protein [Rhizobium phage RHph_I3_18]
MTTVKVKPLEWRPEPPYHVARVFGNVYAVEAWDGGATLSGVGGRRDFKTLDEAKAAAQQDYETRIMSALAPQAGDNAEEPVAWRYRTKAPDGWSMWTVTSEKPDGSAYECEIVPLYERPQSAAARAGQLQAYFEAAEDVFEGKGGDGKRMFNRGDMVRKKSGSSWNGRVVGFYSTELTPVGYCVESRRERGSVQIYPESALIPAKDAQ